MYMIVVLQLFIIQAELAFKVVSHHRILFERWLLLFTQFCPDFAIPCHTD